MRGGDSGVSCFRYHDQSGLFARLLEDPSFRAGDLHTGLLNEFMKTFADPSAAANRNGDDLIAAVLASASAGEQKVGVQTNDANAVSRWRTEARQGLYR